MAHISNKYIINAGKFIRDFEGMYREVDDPWAQREQSRRDLINNNAFRILSSLIQEEKLEIRKILDIGCADGYYAQRLLDLSKRKRISYLGVDISQTAVGKAKKNFFCPDIDFLKHDIRVRKPDFCAKFDLIFSGKTLYYLGPEIDLVLRNIKSYLAKGGLFCFTYNQRPDSFSNKWLTFEKLRRKIKKYGFKEKAFLEVVLSKGEKFACGAYLKGK